MNVYDFDGTIYRGDSTIDFYLWSLIRHPIIIRYWGKQMTGFVMYFLKKYNKKKLKSCFFMFLRDIDVDKEVVDFWDYNEKKIEQWYLDQQQDDDVIISASPDFLLNEICRRLNIQKPVSTVVNTLTGQLESENCRGNEKVKRYLELFPQESINEFYSDSLSDLPMAIYAKYAFRVYKGTIIQWKEGK